jgi:dCMP deaminase
MEQKKRIPPRDVPNRDDFYMGQAFMASRKSKDPSTQMGAYLITPRNKPAGWGYNGPPEDIDDNSINWDRPDKYDFIIHAEENAILNANMPTEGCTLYVTGKPCKACMLRIVRAKIRRIVYFPHKPKDANSMFANESIMDKTDEIAALARVQLEVFKGNLNWMRDDMGKLNDLGVFG